MNKFLDRIEIMNRTYELPLPTHPIAPTGRRLAQFKEILTDEVNEIIDVDSISPEHGLTRIVAYADLLGDLIVYCASEARRHGIPLDEVLSIIMDSNESKLGEDGKPIKDSNEKFLKGPNYWKPEPKIRELILSRL